MILCWDKPRRMRSQKAHDEMYQSDSRIPGTYVPNMGYADMLKWKARLIKGEDLRVEVRKTVKYTQVLLVVREKTITMSTNGKMIFDMDSWFEMGDAIREAQGVLKTERLKC